MNDAVMMNACMAQTKPVTIQFLYVLLLDYYGS